ncbi:MAG: SDR family oxidoreductase [Planctomycetota bacterium]|nr:SDR family oxidoreductase [Planctomycetota bacterium]MDA1211422.1 SDR family oxidoreductase [Planctomycetota bacterium]
MKSSLQDQVAVIIGASSGMGRATAIALAKSGALVTAAARRTERLDSLRTELVDQKISLDTFTVDVTKPQSICDLIDHVIHIRGRIDLLVYATGTNIPERGLKVLTADTWQMMLETNLTGAFHATQAVLPSMRKQQNGLIVYLSTAAVQFPDVSGVAYQASKHGLSGLAHGTRAEGKKSGIRTTVIFPGLCRTEILAKRPVPTPDDVLQHALEPQDVADAVLFVAQLPPRAVVTEMQLWPSRL